MNEQKLKTIGIVDEHQKIIKDEAGKIYYLKEIENYNLSVFAWLKNHPNRHIPTIYSYEEKDGKLEVIESYIEGITLDQILKHDISLSERKELFQQILDGISFLHHANPPIIHRDIKSTNIMIDEAGVVKIIDYDAAKIYQKNQPRDTVLLGTEGVAAPEQYGFGSSDTRTDIYALGILIRTMFLDDLHLLEVADICTQLKPSERYQSIEELEEAIHHLNAKRKPKINIPGFRTGKIWHMLVAFICYFFIAYICFTSEVTVGDEVVTNPVFTIIYRLDLAFILFSWIDIFTSWSGIYNQFPWIKDKNIIKRIIGYAFACMLVLVIASIVQGVCETFLPLS